MESDRQGAPSAARQLLGGGAFVVAADFLQLPSGLLLAAFLSRRLGADGYGLFLLGASLVSWFELAGSSLFSRATVQLVGEARDWQPVASLILRWHVRVSLMSLALMWLMLWPMTRYFPTAGLGPCLALFSLELPLFALARIHNHVLVGQGQFRQRAASSATRWVARLTLTVVLVSLGLGVYGAVLGSVGSCALELLMARRFARPRWQLEAPPGLARRLITYSLPLSMHGMSLQLFHRMALWLLGPLGASLETVGIYGAAQSLLQLRRVMGQSLTPLLLSTLSRTLRDGREQEARELARNALRTVLVTVLPVATVSGAATPIMAWLFGPPFRDGGPVLAWLILSAPAVILLAIAVAIFTAGGRPNWPVTLTAPILPLALIGYLLVIPAHGIRGAAMVTTSALWITALGSQVRVYTLWGIAPRLSTAIRCLAIGALLHWIAGRLPAGHLWLVVELPAVAAFGLLLLLITGEVSREELATAREQLFTLNPYRLLLARGGRRGYRADRSSVDIGRGDIGRGDIGQGS